jgi:hypothetical protein
MSKKEMGIVKSEQDEGLNFEKKTVIMMMKILTLYADMQTTSLNNVKPSVFLVETVCSLSGRS